MTITSRAVKGTSLSFDEMDENFRDLRFDTNLDRVLQNGNTTARSLSVGDLTIAGTINGNNINIGDVTANTVSVTNYRPGEIIETIISNCQGETIEVLSGTYVMENVTDVQTGTNSYADVTGSTINYTPPPGTSKVIYKFNYKFDVMENSGISHHVMTIDGIQVEPSTVTITSNYASTNWHHAGFMIPFEHVIHCDADAEDVSNARFTSWTLPKQLKIRFREYNDSYEVGLHRNNWWDGTGATGDDLFRAPTLIIQAIA